MLFSIAMDYLLIQICTVQDASETREEKEEKGTWPGRVYPFSNLRHTLGQWIRPFSILLIIE